MKILKKVLTALGAAGLLAATALCACNFTDDGERLDKPVVTVSPTAYLSWNAVRHATGYELTLNGETTALTETYYQAPADKDFTFSLIATADGYKNSEAATGSYTAPAPDPVPEDGYYFDSRAEDGGNGTENKPFNSLLDLNKITLEAGDALLFKNGSEFRGEFKLASIEGTAEKPVVITNYGEGTAYPKFNGLGVVGSGVIALENCSYVTVKNLEIYDTTRAEGDRRGVLLTADSADASGFYTSVGITLENLNIHDIRGTTDSENSGMSLASKKTGGIQLWSLNGRGRFDKLTIKGCTIRNVDNVGIATWYRPSTAGSAKVSPYSDAFDKTAHTNVVITGNDISDIGKNAIFARNLKGGLIERNVIHDTAVRCVSGNTICTSYVYGTVIQYNEGYLNRAVKKPYGDGAYEDGCMLDADLQSRDTVWQYNYSHDNAFGLFLNCTSYVPENGVADRATVRYNLSVNDYGNKGIFFINYASEMIEIYNNTVVIGSDVSPRILQVNGGSDRNYSFFNNLIYNLSGSASFASLGSGGIFSDNLVYNAAGADINGLTQFASENADCLYDNPLIIGTLGATVEARSGMNAAQAFKLAANSPALNAGKAVTGVANDFFGNPYRKSIGCYCG